MRDLCYQQEAPAPLGGQQPWWGRGGRAGEPSVVPGPAGALALHHENQSCPLGLSVGYLHCLKIWESPLLCHCRNTPQHHQWAGDTGVPHLAAPPDSPILCGSHPTPGSCLCCLRKLGASSRWRSPRVPGREETWNAGERQLISLCGGQGALSFFRHAEGPEPGISQPLGSRQGWRALPSARPGWRGTMGLSL